MLPFSVNNFLQKSLTLGKIGTGILEVVKTWRKKTEFRQKPEHFNHLCNGLILK